MRWIRDMCFTYCLEPLHRIELGIASNKWENLHCLVIGFITWNDQVEYVTSQSWWLVFWLFSHRFLCEHLVLCFAPINQLLLAKCSALLVWNFIWLLGYTLFSSGQWNQLYWPKKTGSHVNSIFFFKKHIYDVDSGAFEEKTSAMYVQWSFSHQLRIQPQDKWGISLHISLYIRIFNKFRSFLLLGHISEKSWHYFVTLLVVCDSWSTNHGQSRWYRLWYHKFV